MGITSQQMKFFLAVLLLTSAVYTSDKISIQLSFESLCPGCGQVITTSFGPAIEKGLLDMVDFDLVPYGNASESQVGDKYSFQCQHGEEECQGNILDNCIMAHAKDAKTGFLSVVCIEEYANVQGQGFDSALKTCSSKYNFSAADVTTCQKGDEGNKLEHAAAQRTPSDHSYVPWLVVDGSHPGENDENAIFDDVFTWACNKYTGSNKPAGCTKTQKRIVVKSMNTVANRV